MNKTRRALLVAVSALLLVAMTVGGTLAWLTDDTDPVVNTFTAAGIEITLTETYNAKSSENATENDVWRNKLIPGTTYSKDPKVTVVAGSETSWVFVEIVEANNTITDADNNNKVADYALADGWTKVADHGYFGGVVYAYTTEALDATESVYVLKAGTVGANGQVTVSTQVTEATAMPTLTFYAYAIQAANLENHTPEARWALVPKPATAE